MRRTFATVLGLSLLAPAWADPPAKSPKDKVDDVGKAFQAEMDDLQKQFEAAKTPEEKAKLRNKALNEVAPRFAEKMLHIAMTHPKDPAAVDALVFVCTAPG